MATKSSSTAIITIYLLTALFIIIFVILLMMDMNNKMLEQNGVKTKATVTEIVRVERRKRGVSTYGTAEYSDEKGNQYYYNGFLGNSNIEVGSELDIIYNKDDPNKVIRDVPQLIYCVIGAAGLAAVGIFGCFRITFRAKDRHCVSCMQQSVSDEELARIVREYMPQTYNNYQTKKEKNKSCDRIGDDSVLFLQVKSGDPVGEILSIGQKEARAYGQLHLCAVIRPTDQNIYSDNMTLSGDPGKTTGARSTIPAFVVYGTDGYFEAHPSELKTAASRLAGEVWGGQFSQQDMQFIEYLRNPLSRPFNIRYCGDLTMGHDVLITTVLLDKLHLCNKKLSNKLLYILADPQRTKYALILPAWYYSMWELSAF